MKGILAVVILAGLAAGVGASHVLDGSLANAKPLSIGSPDGVLKYDLGRRFATKVPVSQAALPQAGMDGPFTVDLNPELVLTDGVKEGLRFALKIRNSRPLTHRIQYAVEVIDEFDTYYVGPEKSPRLSASPNWEGGLDIPPGLPDGNYYLRLTLVGVREGKLEDDELASFSIAKRQFFAIEKGAVTLLDWWEFQQRLPDADVALKGRDSHELSASSGIFALLRLDLRTRAGGHKRLHQWKHQVYTSKPRILSGRQTMPRRPLP